jgi:Cellulose binding domain
MRLWILVSRRRARVILPVAVVIVVSCVAVVVVMTQSPPASGGQCSATYSVSKQWGTGFTTSVRVTAGNSGIRSWTLRYSYPGKQRLVEGWDGSWSQSGQAVTVTSASRNGALAPGASTAVKAKFAGAVAVPSAVSCSGATAGIATPAPSTGTASPSSTPAAGPGPNVSLGRGFSPALIDSAVAAPLIAFEAPSASDHRPGTSPTAVREAATLFFLALVEREEPGAAGSDGTTVKGALLAQIGHLVAGGNEPDADGGLEGWSHGLVADALVLVKSGPAWADLPVAEQAKVALLEEALGLAGNYTYNDANNFSSGLCGYGNFGKNNNPNYQDGYVGVELAAIQFFGASAWDRMLTGFDYPAFTSRLRAAGFTNAARCYQAAGSSVGPAIARPFVWKGHPAADLMGIWDQLAGDTFDKPVASLVSGTSQGASVTARIADGSTSPEEGKCCMGREFDSRDDSGLRSSALYVFEGWMNVTASRIVLSVLSHFSCASAPTAARYEIGSQDLIYKLAHGYVSYALNQNGILVNSSGDPKSDGPLAKGYAYDLNAYYTLATSSC